MGEYRVVVTGSRTWTDARYIHTELAAVCHDHQNTVIVHGGARGADAIAEQWARDNHCRVERWPADWATYGRRAGILRNKHMLVAGADVCLAFIRDNSPGATHCATFAQRVGIPTRIYRWGDRDG